MAEGDACHIVGIEWLLLSISILSLLVLTASVFNPTVPGALIVRKAVRIWSGKKNKGESRTSNLSLTVEYEVPVLFLSDAKLSIRPVVDQECYLLNGTDESCRQSGVELKGGQLQSLQNLTAQWGAEPVISTGGPGQDDGTHVAPTGWSQLLHALQYMERTSYNWQRHQFDATRMMETRTLYVGFYQKAITLDSQPLALGAPAAQTTLGDLCHIFVTLGMTWVDFDQTSHIYRAEGNGLLATGWKNHGPSLTFDFAQVNKSRFHENRVVPLRDVRELSFGLVPTIFRRPDHFPQGLWCLSDAEHVPRILHTLRLDSHYWIVDTLARIGCHARTRQLFSSTGHELSHVFPVVFELLGMLARPSHVQGTSFRVIPNPTICPWYRAAVDLPYLLASLTQLVRDTEQDEILCTPQLNALFQSIDVIMGEYDAEPVGSSYRLLDELHDAINAIDEYLTDPKHASPFEILVILRQHIDAVVAHLHDPESEFRQLQTARPLKAERLLAHLYVNRIRAQVVVETKPKPSSSSSSTSSLTKPDEPSMAQRQVPQVRQPTLAYGVRDKENNIWCLLVFRMVLWLMLHDFRGSDVQTLGSEALGHRMKVYLR